MTGSPDSIPLRFKLTAGKIFFMVAANTVIALFLTVVHPDARFPVSFLFSQCIGLITASSVIVVVNYFKNTTWRLQMLLIVCAILTGVVLGVSAGRLTVLAFLPAEYAHLLQKYNFNAANIGYAVLFSFIVSYIFISLQRLSDEKIRRLELERNAAMMEIRLLQSQMEPHFLFNTLSTVLGLIETEPKKAARMLESFTAFLRSSFLTARNETTTLAQEMEVVKNYLDIFSVRMGDRLHYRIEIPAELHGLPLPPLVIQPLVENAVKHGLEPSVRGGDLRVQAEKDGQTVRISVSDTGAGMGETGSGNGIGLDNIRKRLYLLYGGRARLVLEENRPAGVRATVELPA